MIDASESTEALEWRQLKRLAIATKNLCNSYTSQLAASRQSPEWVYATVYAQMNEQRQALDDFVISTALSDYVKDRLNDQSYDVQSQVNTAVSLIQAVLDLMNTAVSGLTYAAATPAEYLVSGSITTREFTPAQTSGLRTALQAVSNHISS